MWQGISDKPPMFCLFFSSPNLDFAMRDATNVSRTRWVQPTFTYACPRVRIDVIWENLRTCQMDNDEPWWTMMNHDEPWWTMMNPITNHDSKSNRFREFESSSKIHDSWTVPRLFPHLLFLHLLQFLLSSAFRVCGDLYRFFWPKCGSCEVLIQRLDWEIWTKVI